jgi:hypothetical protein
MRPELAPIGPEIPIQAALQRCSQAQILAIVHAKLTSIEERRSFEGARVNLGHEALTAFAAKILARLGPSVLGTLPGPREVEEGSAIRRIPSKGPSR